MSKRLRIWVLPDFTECWIYLRIPYGIFNKISQSDTWLRLLRLFLESVWCNNFIYSYFLQGLNVFKVFFWWSWNLCYISCWNHGPPFWCFLPIILTYINFVYIKAYLITVSRDTHLINDYLFPILCHTLVAFRHNHATYLEIKPSQTNDMMNTELSS